MDTTLLNITISIPLHVLHALLDLRERLDHLTVDSAVSTAILYTLSDLTESDEEDDEEDDVEDVDDDGFADV
jgi:hypothetical protein